MYERVIKAILNSGDWKVECEPPEATGRSIYYDDFHMILQEGFLNKADLLYKGSHVESFPKRKFVKLWKELEKRDNMEKKMEAEHKLNGMGL